MHGLKSVMHGWCQSYMGQSIEDVRKEGRVWSNADRGSRVKGPADVCKLVLFVKYQYVSWTPPMGDVYEI